MNVPLWVHRRLAVTDTTAVPIHENCVVEGGEEVGKHERRHLAREHVAEVVRRQQLGAHLGGESIEFFWAEF